MDPERAGWTTRGAIATRGGASSEKTHIRYRHYRADSIHTVAVGLEGEGSPSLDEVAAALREPARPLFLGRKACLPSGPVLYACVEAASLVDALQVLARVGGRGDPGPLPVWWWDGDVAPEAVTANSHVVPVTDERDWANQVHVGRRLMREGMLNPPEATHG
ncbi:MAG: type I-E CRISPR-associated protein Cas5/CasD [Myxococcales bacterium]